MGSEEFIRLQFEEYLLALLSCMQYHEELESYNSGESGRRSQSQLQAFNIEGDPALEFNPEFLAKWKTTANYALFKQLTSDALLYSIVEPRHPCAGGLTIDDIQRRLTQQVAELHLDERVREGREALNRHLASGQKKVSAAINSFWADIDAMREAQRKKNEGKATTNSQRSSMDKGYTSIPPSDSMSVTSNTGSTFRLGSRRAPSVDLSQAQASVTAVGQKASAYISSWASWATEKRKEWQDKKSTPTASPPMTSSSTPMLAGVTESSELRDRDRPQSIHRHSEDLVGLSRTASSRKKRWSNIILHRESGDFGSLHKRANDSFDAGDRDVLSKEYEYLPGRYDDPEGLLSRELSAESRDNEENGASEEIPPEKETKPSTYDTPEDPRLSQKETSSEKQPAESHPPETSEANTPSHEPETSSTAK